MSRVPVDTVLLRLALAAAITLPLSGCGGDDADSAVAPTTQAPVTTTPTTPAATAGPTAPSAEDQKGNEDVPDAAASADAAPDDDAPVDTKTSAAKASPKQQSNDEIAGDMKKAYDALKAAGFDPGKPLVSGESSGALQIKETTVVFYPSPRLAAEQAVRFEEALKGGPQQVKLARRANRLFLLSLPTPPTAKQLEDFRKIRQITNGAV
ncbi:MAG: hypothetical protein JHD16_18070 [Solirubrobacteraceae bacterium]|nr:hypothetical protein [Solirubrobacteraceae bacterium]